MRFPCFILLKPIETPKQNASRGHQPPKGGSPERVKKRREGRGAARGVVDPGSPINPYDYPNFSLIPIYFLNL